MRENDELSYLLKNPIFGCKLDVETNLHQPNPLPSRHKPQLLFLLRVQFSCYFGLEWDIDCGHFGRKYGVISFAIWQSKN